MYIQWIVLLLFTIKIKDPSSYMILYNYITNMKKTQD